MKTKITFLLFSLIATTLVMAQTAPVLHFKFNNNPNDSSSNYFASSTIGSVSYVNGRKGESNGALVTTSGAAALTVNSGAYKTTFPFTFATWLKINQLGSVNPIFTNEDDQTTYSGIWIQLLAQGEVAANVGNAQATNSNGRKSAITNSPVVTQINTWYQIVVVATSISDIKIYVNGVLAPSYLDGSATSLVYLNSNNNVAKVGSYNKGSANNYYLDGVIDELALWNTAIGGNELNDILADGMINYTSVESITSADFSIYPNPANSNATLVLPSNFSEGITSLKVYNVMGAVVKEDVISSTKTYALNVENLAKGLYFILLQNNGAIAQQSIVVE
jgi:hypothetical protein